MLSLICTRVGAPGGPRRAPGDEAEVEAQGSEGSARKEDFLTRIC